MNAFARAATENLGDARERAPPLEDTPASRHVAELAAAAADGGPSLYERLEVAADAPGEAVTKSYRSLARRYHPDRGGAASAAAMVELNDAYEILKDPVQRAAYDARLRTLRDERRREADADAAFAESLRGK